MSSLLPPSTEGTPPASGGAATVTPAFSPLYQQIKGLILHSLQHGEWKPGEAIPSEIELAARFRVSQGTVRKAIDELAAENLVTRRQGKGTFVATHAERQVQYRFLKLLPDAGGIPEWCAGDSVIQIKRILSFVGVPTILEDIWLPGQAFKGLTAEQLAHYQGPTYAMFELDFGVRMVRAEEKIRAVLPDETQAQWLNVPAGTPLLSVERLAYTYNDVPMELRRGLYRTDTHHYHNKLN